MPERFVVGAFPAFVDRAQGCHLWDADGNKYIDYSMACAAVALGYSHPTVNDAIRRQLQRGTTASLPFRLEAEVAEQLCAVIPWARDDGMVRWVSTGSEATEAAVRVARIVTGRDLVISIGYHSWYSTFTAARPYHPGVPDSFAEPILDLPYNDLAVVDSVIEGRGDHLAAIIVEPTLLDAPAPGYLEGLRERCTRLGAVLIFDEIVCGGRWAVAGGAEYFGVTPDLACYGKALGNGTPVAALVGRRALMEDAGVLISGTMGGNALGLAAVSAALGIYARDPVIPWLWRVGGKFQEGLREIIAAYRVPAVVDGYPVHPRLRFLDDPDHRQMSLFLQETAARGVLLHPSGWNVSFAHTNDDVEQSLDACREGFAVVMAAIQSEDYSRLLGAPLTASLIRVLPVTA